MKKSILILCIVLSIFTINSQIFQDPARKKDIETDFKIRKELSHYKVPFETIEKSGLLGDTLDALKFLYAYMPVPDVVGYSPDFFKENVMYTLRAREEMPWGNSVPEQEFVHYVLPVRVKNEMPDSFRIQYYEELKERVQGMTMEEAILEVNHWCHEKVTYRASDGRTSSPLSTLSQAIGRCGEESTFTVTALRTIGIPARQVYTSRWAHTDDNHAWVEAYADGKWHFLGACEPEPVLDLGWFNEPVSRGILMNTSAIGKYMGEEEILSATPLSANINVTPNYTKTDTLRVIVKDVNGKPLNNIKVNFCIYNYAEFYPVVSKNTDPLGKVSLIAGHGDMLIWGTDGENYGFAKGNSKDGNVIEVILDKTNDYEGDFELVLTPSPSNPVIPQISPEIRKNNDKRLAYEDSVRNQYISTFATPQSSKEWSRRLGLNEDKAEKVLTESRGNHAKLENFIESLPVTLRPGALDMLLAVTEKDRRDISIEALEDHLFNSPLYPDSTLHNDYVVNPRIEKEEIVAYKKFFGQQFSNAEKEKFRKQPSLLVDWVKENISINSTWNPEGHKMTPVSVWLEREATPSNRNIFFVALARSLGVPARIDPVTSATLYLDNNGEWIDTKFSGEDDAAVSAKSVVNINFEPQGRVKDPLYYSQFSISKLIDGVPRQLEYDENDRLSDINRLQQPLDEGKYLLVSGQRMADGTVMAKGKIFNLPANSNLTVDLIIPQDTTQIQVIGNLNAENLYEDLTINEIKSIISTTGRGYYVLGFIKANHEPTKHILNDLILAKSEIEKWPGKILFFFPNEEEVAKFDFSEFDTLPSNVIFGIDTNQNSRIELSESLMLDKFETPVLIIADTFNRVVYFQEGYCIGTGERILDILEKL